MDSVIVHFRRYSTEDIERAAAQFGVKNEVLQQGETHIYLTRYSRRDFEAEYDENDKCALVTQLGGPPTASFQILARHGTGAQLALQLVVFLFSHFHTGVLDDDFDGFWKEEDILTLLETHSDAGIYDLRKRPAF